jgi:hypothetical protein
VSDYLEDLCSKHSCIFSRELVTVVLDDSVFKQWLSSFKLGEDFESCYGKFFSGQTRSSVYGFRVLSLGVCIDGVLYPLYFEYVRKKSKASKKPEAIKQAEKLVHKFGNFRNRLVKKGIEIPDLHFSCDNGYSHLDLANCCQNNHLIYISVPTKSHLFEIKGRNVKLSDWINQIYLPLEKEYYDRQNELKGTKPKPFIYRFKGIYRSKKLAVTMIAFRLNDSKKVSIVYSTNATIFRKTMRRHWFQRTYIEQFFKLLKHVLKIQETKTKDKRGFTFKLWRFAWMALQVQRLVKYARKKTKFENKGFIYIQRLMRKDDEIIDLLQNLVRSKF